MFFGNMKGADFETIAIALRVVLDMANKKQESKRANSTSPWKVIEFHDGTCIYEYTGDKQ